MKIYLVERKGGVDYDEYDSAVIAAKDKTDARLIFKDLDKDDDLKIKVVGSAIQKKSGVILGSFNAG